MNRAHVGLIALLAGCAVQLGLTASAHANFHLWHIQEIYSNSDGTVQFVELFTNSTGQQFLSGQTLTSNSHSFPFTTSPSPTEGHHLLLGTPAYATLAAAAGSNLAAPNYTFATNNFFSVTGDTIKFATIYDTDTFASIPTDGVMSLNYTSASSAATIAANTPRNYLGTATGALNLPPPPPPNNGDYNGDLTVDAADYTVWRNTLGMAVAKSSGADGNNNSLIDAGDYSFWKLHFGEPVGGAGASLPPSAVPEPATFFLILAVMIGLEPRRRIRPTRLAASGPDVGK